MSWKFKREEQKFKELDEGKYRIRIKSAEKAISKNGNDMLAFQFEVSGTTRILYHYIVFLNDKPEVTNRMLTAFFDSFTGIPEGDFNTNNWIGQVGACMVKHDDEGRAKISYFIKKDKQGDLPNWKNPDGTEVDENGFIQISDDDIPDF